MSDPEPLSVTFSYVDGQENSKTLNFYPVFEDGKCPEAYTFYYKAGTEDKFTQITIPNSELKMSDLYNVLTTKSGDHILYYRKSDSNAKLTCIQTLDCFFSGGAGLNAFDNQTFGTSEGFKIADASSVSSRMQNYLTGSSHCSLEEIVNESWYSSDLLKNDTSQITITPGVVVDSSSDDENSSLVNYSSIYDAYNSGSTKLFSDKAYSV